MRRAEERDLDGVFRMERAIAELPHWTKAMYASYLRGEEAAADRLLLVAESEAGGELVGFAAATSRPAPVGLVELESVAVAMAARRQGIARALCGAVVAWGEAQGAGAIELEVRAGSSGAIALYRSLGFREAGLRRRYYRNPVEDAVLLSLPNGGADGGK